MAKRGGLSRDGAIRRFDVVCGNLLLLRREKFVRALTDEEQLMIDSWEAERQELRRLWPDVMFGQERAAPRQPATVPGEKPKTMKPHPKAKAEAKKKPRKSEAKKDTYFHDSTAFRRDRKAPRTAGREIYATGRITVVGGGLPETRRR